MKTSTLERRRFALVPVGFALCIFVGMLLFLQIGRSIGIKDIDYRGNAVLESYPAPTEAIAYALKRSGLG